MQIRFNTNRSKDFSDVCIFGSTGLTTLKASLFVHHAFPIVIHFASVLTKNRGSDISGEVQHDNF